MKFKDYLKPILENKINPYKEKDFEKRFIGKQIDDVKVVLNKYDLHNQGVSVIIDKNGNIKGFSYDRNTDGYFDGKKIDDFKVKEVLDFWTYQM